MLPQDYVLTVFLITLFELVTLSILFWKKTSFTKAVTIIPISTIVLALAPFLIIDFIAENQKIDEDLNKLTLAVKEMPCDSAKVLHHQLYNKLLYIDYNSTNASVNYEKMRNDYRLLDYDHILQKQVKQRVIDCESL